MKTKKEMRRALKSCAYSVWLFFAVFIAGVVSSCADERFNPQSQNVIDVYWQSERVAIVETNVEDDLAKSDLTFTQTSYIYSEKDEFRQDFSPEAYVRIRLAKERIEVSSAEELPVTAVREYILSKTPYADNAKSMFGVDVVKVSELSDGNVATIEYGWRATGFISGADTLWAPHAEPVEVAFKEYALEEFGEKTETEDPYKLIAKYNATYVIKGTSAASVSRERELAPWYYKIIMDDPTSVENVTYEGRFVDCPYNAYELVEKVVTNKGEFSNTYRVSLSLNVTAPDVREQPSLDSLFASVSVGKLTENVFSEIKDANGFTIRTMSGTYVSTATGKEKSSKVESTASFTYQFPVKFESEYGSYDIAPLKLSFRELGFAVTRVSETADEVRFKSVNSVQGTIGTCVLDVIDETVNLVVGKEKAPDVTKTDSTYVVRGDSDEYIIDKTIIWSDGSTTTSTYSYSGRHQASAKAFGEVITTSLNWNESELKRVSQATETEEKKFSSVTKFTAVYTTSQWQSDATNGSERGYFSFSEMSPVVTFVDGNTTKVFPERKYTLAGIGADVAGNYSEVIRNGISYKAYAYDYLAKATFNGGAVENLVSEGLLLMNADVVGETTYTPSQSWSGNTVTVKVTKTTPHSHADDEVKVFDKSFTVGVTGLTNGKVYADNTSFTTSETHSETSNSTTASPWTVKSYQRDYAYVVSNGAVKRDDLKATVTDAEITFNDGVYTHTFNVRLDVTKAEKFNAARTDGSYTVTPHVLTVTGTSSDGKSFNTSGTTEIYVKRDASVTGHTEKTVVYPDGTVDAEITISKDDGTSETVKASDAFGSRFAFNFENATAQEKVVQNVSHTANGTTGTAVTSPHQQGGWTVTEYRYPYTHELSNGIAADKVTGTYKYSNFKFVYSGSGVSSVEVPMPVVTMAHKSLNITNNGVSGGYTNYGAAVVVSGSAKGTEGSYAKDLAVTHTLKVVYDEPQEPDQPHLGKPKGFVVTATFDPTSKVTRRAFCFNWEDGVTYAVCDYETMLPGESDFMFKEDSYTGYNSVGYDKDNANHWQPARGTDDSDAIRWYFADGSLMSAIDKDLSCMVIGWKNIVSGKYALVIPGYTYTIDGYNITVTAPNGQKVTFNSHHK